MHILKKILIQLTIIFFSTNLVASEISMFCKRNGMTYKHVQTNDGYNILHFHPARDGKNNWIQFCPSKVTDSNSGWVKELVNVNLTVTENKAICTAEKIVGIRWNPKDPKKGKEIIIQNSVSTLDFKKISRTGESFVDGNNKKSKFRYKCKKN